MRPGIFKDKKSMIEIDNRTRLELEMIAQEADKIRTQRAANMALATGHVDEYRRLKTKVKNLNLSLYLKAEKLDKMASDAPPEEREMLSAYKKLANSL